MSIFPQFDNVEVVNNVTLPLYKDVAWDFVNNRPLMYNNDFKIVEGNEAIKSWIYRAIKTQRFRHIIYSWDFGSEIESLISQRYTKDLIKAEVERYVKEALLINEYIQSVDVVNVNFESDVLSVDVNVTTIYGEVSVNVQ